MTLDIQVTGCVCSHVNTTLNSLDVENIDVWSHQSLSMLKCLNHGGQLPDSFGASALQWFAY